jgi:hypothetical protein
VSTTTGPRATRRNSASPRAGSDHWCTVTVAITASKESSSNGSRSAAASSAGTAPEGRWARMPADGSTATTYRSVGS